MNRTGWLLAIVAVLLGIVAPNPQAARADVLAAPDLIVESIEFIDPITDLPVQPVAGVQVRIRATIKNIGDAPAQNNNLRIAFYPDQPAAPAAGDPTIHQVIYTLAIPAGGSATAAIVYTYAAINCANKAWAYADSQGAVAESNEGNNAGSASPCPAPTCVPDGFEADNTCTAARWMQEGASQRRSLCSGDQDWIKFTGFAGVAYTVTASKPPTSTAATRVTLFGSCGGAAVGGPGAGQAVFTPANSGVYYAKVDNTAPADDKSAYDLSVSSNTGITDAFEPDDSCALARDILTNGTKQQHRFNRNGDEDWVRFTAQAGESFIVVADNPGSGDVKPVITLSTSCAQAAANQPVAEVSAADAGAADVSVTGSSATTQLYYVRVHNENGTLFGQSMTYDLRVSSTACAADAFEPDSSATPKPLELGAPQANHTACPPGDEDWVRFSVQAGKTYVLETTQLGPESDTVLQLFADGGALIGENDDFGYTNGSRIVFQPQTSGFYRAKVRQANVAASGAGTRYTIALREGFCLPDALEGQQGNNGPGDAKPLPVNTPQPSSFCADALNASLGDQDWLSFAAVPGGEYQVKTQNLGPNSDTVVELYSASGALLATNDDAGDGLSTILRYKMPAAEVIGAAPQPLFVRVRPFNSGVNGGQTDYQVALSANEPPPPTPTPTPAPIPPAPTPTPNPASARTLFVVNKARLTALYGAGPANAVIAKLFEAADDPDVQGAVIQLDTIPAVAAAYAAWTASPQALADQNLANAVAAAVRANLMTFLEGSATAKAVVIVGDDRVVPFRRVPDLVPAAVAGESLEPKYAPDVSADASVRAALAANMVLTDDYFVDKEPGTWKDKQNATHELYLPDFAVSRLLETPAEIIGSIDQALGDGTIELGAGKVLVTGYDFVQDGASLIETLFQSDQVQTSELIGPAWPIASMEALHINAVPPFAVTSINGHSTHLAIGTADNGKSIRASQITTGTTNFAGALVFSVGCHAGLPDPALLDLPQAYLRRGATYVGNTGFGWGGGGVVYTEALMRNFAREVLRGLSSEVGQALVAAKLKYYSKAAVFNAFDAKVLMQSTLYGLPFVKVTSADSLTGDEEFPDAGETPTPPTSFAGMASGGLTYNLTGSFGVTDTVAGTQYDLNDKVSFAPGEPVQPAYNSPESFAAFSSNAGTLRGAVLLEGSYTQQQNFDAVIALAENEYITDRSEPSYTGPDAWSPALPFVVRNGDGISATIDSLVLSLGQFNPGDATSTGVAAAEAGLARADTGVQRLYGAMSLATFYSFSADEVPATVSFVDGVLDPAAGKATVKVEAQDASGVTKVVVAYTTPVGATAQWKSAELAYDAAAAIWRGQFPATTATEFFVQVVDGAGNVAVDDNKGLYYPLPAPLPLKQGRGFAATTIWLPVVER